MSELPAKKDDEVKEEVLSDDENVLKSKKVKRVCSDKQLEALKRNRECNNKLRTEEAKEKKLKKAIELVEKHKVKEQENKPKPKQVIKEESESESESSSSEEEVVIKKKKRIKEVKEVKKTKKKKVITIELSDSDSDSEEEEEEPVKKQKPLKARDMITQQNKKSLIKVHKPAEQINYFCD
jgi:hypothetical protein